MRHAAAVRLMALVALAALAGVALAQAPNSNPSTESDYDAGENSTLMAQLTANSPFANAVFTATNLCTATCQAAYVNMTMATSTNGACDQCTSNSGNSSLAAWSANSTKCGQCAAKWNTYNASCNTPATPANRACYNFQVIADGSNPTSLASLMTVGTGATLGDVYDFFSGFASLVATCSDAVDYAVNYGLTTAFDPAGGAQGAPCPTVKSASQTCSSACNSVWNMLQYNCQANQLVQYDFNGLPGGVAAPANTFLPIETVVNLILNGSAFGPFNDDYNNGNVLQNLALSLSDPTCVASAWLGQILSDGTTSVNMNGPVAQQAPVSVNTAMMPTAAPAPVLAGGPTPAPAAMTCALAAAAMNTSTSTGNCAQCLSDTGNGQGCLANCPQCANDWSNVVTACGATGDSTLQLTYNLAANVWGDNLLQVAGNFTFDDCYIYAMTFAEPLAATCSDYFDYMTSYSQTNFFTNPLNASQVGPGCPTTASDSVYPSGSCPSSCKADLANLAGCNSGSMVIPPGGGAAVTFASAWASFVSGAYAAVDPFYNTFTTNSGGAAYNLSGCTSFMSTVLTGVLPAGTVSNSLPAAPTCAQARATLNASTVNGACDLCSSNTGNPNNCFTSVSGDANCTLCGAQYDVYTSLCTETYNDIGNLFAANLAATMGSGSGGDCFDMFNQIAQSSIGTTGFDTDACSDAWDSILQYSETMLNDPVAGLNGPNCPTNPAATSCPLACQNDLAQLNAVCTSTSVVKWAGYGLPGSTTPAAANTTVNITNAWAYFANGTATSPIGNAVVNGSTVSLPFALANCTLPTWVPAAAAAALTPVVIQGSFSISLPAGTTLSQLYAKNQAAGGALESTIAASLGVNANAVTILWSQMGAFLLVLDVCPLLACAYARASHPASRRRLCGGPPPPCRLHGAVPGDYHGRRRCCREPESGCFQPVYCAGEHLHVVAQHHRRHGVSHRQRCAAGGAGRVCALGCGRCCDRALRTR